MMIIIILLNTVDDWFLHAHGIPVSESASWTNKKCWFLLSRWEITSCFWIQRFLSQSYFSKWSSFPFLKFLWGTLVHQHHCSRSTPTRTILVPRPTSFNTSTNWLKLKPVPLSRWINYKVPIILEQLTLIMVILETDAC